MRLEPHTGACPDCGHPIITATRRDGSTVVLEPTPDTAGEYRAHYTPHGWVCTPHDANSFFGGMRRREHACPDVQLELSTEGASAAPVSLQATEEAMCPSADSPRSTALRSSSSESS